MVVWGGTHERYANYLPWVQLSREKGISLIELQINDTGNFDISELDKIISQGTRKATKTSMRN